LPTLTIRVPEKEYERLVELAKDKQIPASTLARSFIVSKLNQETSASEQARAVIDAIEKDTQLAMRFRRLMLFPGEKA